MKKFFTYEQQIEKLKNKGLIIEDEEEAMNILELEGYFNIISGYSAIFQSTDKSSQTKRYINGTTFNNINKLYLFDKRLQAIVYKYALTVECHIKALVAHKFSEKYGVKEEIYLKKENFSDSPYVTDLIETCKKAISEGKNRQNKKYKEYVAHNLEKHGHIPLWILVRALTFGTISRFYSLMKAEDRRPIADRYGLTVKQLSNMLEMLVNFRNIVAHGERTFCTKLNKLRLNDNLSVIKKISIPKNGKGCNRYGQRDFLALIIIFKYLLPAKDFAGLVDEIGNQLEILRKNISADAYGKVKHEMGIFLNDLGFLTKINSK